MSDSRTTVTLAYEPSPERFAVTCASEAGDQFTLDALQTTASNAFKQMVLDVLGLYAAADRAAESLKENPGG